MPHQKQYGQLSRLLRRAVALFLSACALWLLFAAARPGLSAGLFGGLGENPLFVMAALRAELGPPPSAERALAGMNWWQNTVLAESLFLRAGEGAVTAFLSGGRSAETPAKLLPPTREVLLGEEEHSIWEDDEPSPSSGAQADTNIVARTLLPGNSAPWQQAGGVFLYNQAGLSLDLPALAAAPFALELGDAPAVLIYHTHGSEAYARTAEDSYDETDPARTTDTLYNVVRVGDELAAALKAAGISVIHDRTLYDYPLYNNSYARSLEGVTAYLEKYPSIRVALDLHRDALEGEDGVIYKTVAEVEGETAAQLLLVVGSGAAGQTHDDWQENLKFALALQKELDASFPTLARPIALRAPRYNQQIFPGALLIEMGSHGNTLEEALRSARLLGRALSALLAP